jgi:glycosyltransferase involved in cell wall biosynthesis
MLMNLSSNIKISCTKDALISTFGKKYFKKRNSFIIPNPIDTIKFKRTKKYSKSRGNPKIVHVGRYCINKNQILLIEILPYILRELPDVVLQLIGFGEEYKKQLENKAISLGVQSRVEFLPSDSDVKAVLEEASLFIFPSISEGFGIALLEAQAMEVPCLVSDSVPKDVDCGLCKFLSLSEKREVWAKEAVNIIKNKHSLKLNRDKLNSLDVTDYVSKIKSIYEGVVI